MLNNQLLLLLIQLLPLLQRFHEFFNALRSSPLSNMPLHIQLLPLLLQLRLLLLQLLVLLLLLLIQLLRYSLNHILHIKPLEHPARPEHPDRDPAALGVEGEQFAEGGDLEVARGRLRAVRHLLGCVVLVDLRLCILSGGRNRPLLMIAVPGWRIWLYLATKYLLE